VGTPETGTRCASGLTFAESSLSGNN